MMKLKKKLKKKPESTQVNLTNPLPVTWDQDKKLIFFKNDLKIRIEVKYKKKKHWKNLSYPRLTWLTCYPE
jgi:hypothetical protein